AWGESFGKAVRNATTPLRKMFNLFSQDQAKGWEAFQIGGRIAVLKLKLVFAEFMKWLGKKFGELWDFMGSKAAYVIKKRLLTAGKRLLTAGVPDVMGMKDRAAKSLEKMGILSPAPDAPFGGGMKGTRSEMAALIKELNKRLAEVGDEVKGKGAAAGGPDKPFDIGAAFLKAMGPKASKVVGDEKTRGVKTGKTAGFEFSSFAGLWQQTQAKLGKEQDRLVKLAEKDAVVQNKILTAVEDIPLARWA
ncbi:MAG TPA: hypothetical protein VM223_15280, partial [Planctomycetota bacterium]|nr:hypothetical protein [Planctomycetota bacterium]